MQVRLQARCQELFCSHLLLCQDKEYEIAEKSSTEFLWVEVYLANQDIKHHIDLHKHLHRLPHLLSLFLHLLSLFLLQLRVCLHQLRVCLHQLRVCLHQPRLCLHQLSQFLQGFLGWQMLEILAMLLLPSKCCPQQASIPSYLLGKLQ